MFAKPRIVSRDDTLKQKKKRVEVPKVSHHSTTLPHGLYGRCPTARPDGSCACRTASQRRDAAREINLKMDDDRLFPSELVAEFRCVSGEVVRRIEARQRLEDEENQRTEIRNERLAAVAAERLAFVHKKMELLKATRERHTVARRLRQRRLNLQVYGPQAPQYEDSRDNVDYGYYSDGGIEEARKGE